MKTVPSSTKYLFMLLALSAIAFASLPARAAVINGHEWELNLEYRQFTPGNPPISRRVYICNTSIAGNCVDYPAWNAQTAEPGWEVAPARVRLFNSGTNALPTTTPGVPAVIDFNGYSMVYGADVIEGALVGLVPGVGVFAVAQVDRDTVLTYDAGTVVHEVVDTTGGRYMMFTAEVGVAQAYDLTVENALLGLALPGGWSYESRTLESDFDLDSDGRATVFAAPGTSWQFYRATAVPAPAPMSLLFLSLLVFACQRHLRSSAP